MQPITRARRRSRFLVSAAAMAAVFAVPSVASATVRETHVTTPTDDVVLNAPGGVIGAGSSGGPGALKVSGTAPGAADGDELTLICTYELYGTSATVELTDGSVPVVVHDGTFSTTTAQTPPYTCRIRAIPADLGLGDTPIGVGLTPEQEAAFTGPRVLGGAFATSPFGTSGGTAESWAAFRGQRRGLGFLTGAGFPGFGLFGTGTGIALSFYNEDTTYRAMFAGSGSLSIFRSFPATRAAARAVPDIDLADAPLVVDGKPAALWPAAGDELGRVVSHSVDPATGDLTVVETAPIGLFDASTGFADDTLGSAGLRLRRTTVQDHDGRQITFSDTFESTDGAAHALEVRYGEGIFGEAFAASSGLTQTAAPEFRVPWGTGTAYVEPSAGDPIPAAPPGPATIYVHGGQFAYTRATTRAARRATSRAASAPISAEGAITFDAPPSDGRFLSPDDFVVRFVRSVPAGGSTAIEHVYSQEGTAEGLGGLVSDATGGTPSAPPAPPLPATTPLPTAPAPVGPVATPFDDPLERVSLAARGLLLKPHLGRRIRDGRRTFVAISNMPAGRYTVAVRRYVKNGRTLASGAVTRSARGTVKVPVDLSRYGKGYFAAKRESGESEVKVRVEVSYAAPGKKALRKKKIRVVRFR